MDIQRHAASVIVRAPAKLNLFFEVLAKRSDGYHEIESLMVPVDLVDTLVATPDPSGQISLGCRWVAGSGPNAREAFGEIPPDESNLATRAIKLLRERANIDAGLRVELIKRIPLAAGLGGGSSDAAAALLAANEVWQLGWSREALSPLAAQLGSDVPFFLFGGAAVCRGRGEVIEPVGAIGPLHVVVVRPPEGLATAQVYARCQVPTEPRKLTPLLSALGSGDMRGLQDRIYNRLEPAAESLSPWVGRLRHEMAGQDCLAWQMSGSGSSYFGICRHALHARRVAHRLHARGIGQVFAASTSP